MITLLPTPKECKIIKEEKMQITPCIYTSDASWEKYARIFIDYFKLAHNIEIHFAPGGIELELDASVKSQAYLIESGKKVTVKASSDEGIRYALASLMQIFTLTDRNMSLEHINIYDYPDKEYRAIMVDLGRQWHPFDKLLRFVDRERWDPRDILDWNVYNWQHWWPNSKAYSNPINVEPTDSVIGSMMCVWEMNYEQEINFMIENLVAMSERVWNVERKKTDEEYFECQLTLTGMVAKIIQDR